jgi:hypothetical protein
MWQVQPGSLSASWACRKRERVLFIKINKDFFLFLHFHMQDRTCKMLHKHGGGGAGQLCHTREFQKQVQVREGCLPALMCSAFIAAFFLGKALHFPPCPSLHFIINWASPKHLPPKASFVVVKTFRFACESKAAGCAQGAGPRAQSCMAQTARQRAMMRATALHCKRQPPSRSTSRARQIARVESGRQQRSSRTRCLLPWHHGCSDAN